MSFLSIRKLPRDLEKALLQEAKRRKTTKTEIVLKALEDQFGLESHEKKRKKVRQFFGRMTQRQYESFKKATEGFSEIEEDLWR